ncbi:MAG TPA: dihydroxyacetone kinase subunit DhaL [Virgibacillus sp.]|nr:dihydroxyacetone kinase subunit DhaL [Virgibacillus sp.]
MEIQIEETIKWFQKTNAKLQANKAYLTDLDQAIGDGDHGINMARGFNEVINKINDTDEYASVSDVVKDVAMTVISKVGGAAGPLYGTAFLKMSVALKGEEVVNQQVFAKALSAGFEGIKQRGKVEVGEKTLLDVWYPVTELFRKESDVDADALIEVAESAMNKTKEILATKGRAAYLKERSIGHIDPGSASSYYLFLSLAEVMKEAE